MQSAQVLTPLSASSPTPLRRASYAKVCDLIGPFNIDEEKLKSEIDKSNEEVGEKTEDTTSSEKDPIETPESSEPTSALSKLKHEGSKENVSLEGYQRQSKTSQKKLSPPSKGFNLCVLVGSVEIVVDKLRVDRSRVRLAEVKVGDETGCCFFRARDDQIDDLKEISERKGAVVLRNTTIELYQGRHIRLAVTKWGKISTFPDEVASTPNPPVEINDRMNYSAIDLNLVLKEEPAPSPSSPESGDNSSPSSSTQSGGHRKATAGSFDDSSRATRSSTSSKPNKGRRGSRKQNLHKGHAAQNLGHIQVNPAYLAPYHQAPGSYMPDMGGYAPAMYSAQGSPEIPQYGYQQPKGGQNLTAYEAEHHHKQQELIAQQYELQQRHHFQQMQLFQQQQENHRRLIEAQQHQLASPDLSSRGGPQSTVPSLSSSAFPPMNSSSSRMHAYTSTSVRPSMPTSPPAGPVDTVAWPDSAPTSPMNPRAMIYAPQHGHGHREEHGQAQSRQLPYVSYEEAAALHGSSIGSQHQEQQLYSQVAATFPATHDGQRMGSPYAPLPGKRTEQTNTTRASTARATSRKQKDRETK